LQKLLLLVLLLLLEDQRGLRRASRRDGRVRRDAYGRRQRRQRWGYRVAALMQMRLRLRLHELLLLRYAEC
jgi:hypothetical protein